MSCRNLQLAQVDLHYQKRLICTRLKRMTNQSLPMKENVVHPRDRHVIIFGYVILEKWYERKKALMKGTRDEKVAQIAEQGLEIKEDLERKGMLSQRTRTSSALYLNKMAQGMDTQTLPVSYSLNNRLIIR